MKHVAMKFQMACACACALAIAMPVVSIADEAANAGVDTAPAEKAEPSAQEPATPGEDATRFVIASWNTENFFDADDDPDNEGDDDYLPSGWTRWTQARYEEKTEHLAKIIAEMKPDAIFLTEVENFRVLRDLRDAVKAAGWEMPCIVHKDGPDKRGIDNAMLARIKPDKVEWMSPTPYQRLILIADFTVGGRKLTVFGNHWKSYYGDLNAAIATRTKEAHAEREEIEKRLKADPNAAIITMGDFNDSWDAPILVDEAGFSTNRADVIARKPGNVLFNLASGRPKKEVRSYYYARKNRWDSFDTMSVSPGMLPESEEPAPWQVDIDPKTKLFKYRVFTIPEMCNPENGSPIPFRRVIRKADVEVLSGFSDHFPVRVELVPGAK